MIVDRESWQRILATIAQDGIFLEERSALFSTLGIDPAEWPHCEGKILWEKFLRAEAKKGRGFALNEYGDEAEGLIPQPLELPFTPTELKALHDDAVSYGKGLELSKAIQKNPDRARELVDGFRLTASRAVRVSSLSEIVFESLSAHLHRVNTGEAMVAIPRWENLSKLISGFNPGRVILLVAQTGKGKTTLALNLGIDATQVGGVLYFNMEMPQDDIVARVLVSRAGMRFSEWHSGRIDYEKIQNFVDQQKQFSDFFFTDGRALTLNQILSTVSFYKAQHNIKFVIVDYDQKIRMRDRGEQWMLLLRAAEEFEEIAKSLDLNVIVLAQGNDYGDPKASERSKQPASAVLNFDDGNDGFHYITPVKNRFGTLKNKIRCSFFGESALVKEMDVVSKSSPMPTGKFVL